MYEYSIYKKGEKLHKSTHRTIHTSALELKHRKKNCTTVFYILAVSITYSFNRSFNNKKAAKMEKEDVGGSEKL